jgi:hypothetical protein
LATQDVRLPPAHPDAPHAERRIGFSAEVQIRYGLVCPGVERADDDPTASSDLEHGDIRRHCSSIVGGVPRSR